jgi:undecaprenyl-diphosphatase
MHHLSDLVVAMVNGTVAALLAWGWLRRSDDPSEDRSQDRRDLDQTRA